MKSFDQSRISSIRTVELLFIVLIGAVLFTACGEVDKRQPQPSPSVAWAFEERKSDVQIGGEGVVAKILTDDKVGSPHQRFILQVSPGQTVLIQHNIELAPRISGLREGDTVSFFGEYVWNAQGGLIHWTHHDPAGRHEGGWLKHKERTYQ